MTSPLTVALILILEILLADEDEDDDEHEEDFVWSSGAVTLRGLPVISRVLCY